MGLLELLPIPTYTLFIGYSVCKIINFILLALGMWKNNCFSSEIIRIVLIKWIAEILGIIFVIAMGFVLGLDFMLCNIIIGSFIYKEGVNICENLLTCGVSMPNSIAERLKNLDESKDDEKSENNK